MADLVTLQRDMGVSFKDISLLELALTHSSYINENPGFHLSSNERLEFLGDAVLGLVVADALYQYDTRLTDGEMTRLRAALVRGETLARMAKTINLGQHLYLGKGEESGGGRKKSAILAAALEAVIAAVYIDSGFNTTRDFILKLLDEELLKVTSQGAATDYKSALQELTQSREHKKPAYQIKEETGPDHQKKFIVEVKLNEKVIGRGSGGNKKAAETEAARVALEWLSSNFTE